MKLYNYFVLHSEQGSNHSWRVIRAPIGEGWDSSNRQFWSRRRTWIGGGGTAGMYDSAAYKRAKTYKNDTTAERAMKRIAINRARSSEHRLVDSLSRIQRRDRRARK